MALKELEVRYATKRQQHHKLADGERRHRAGAARRLESLCRLKHRLARKTPSRS